MQPTQSDFENVVIEPFYSGTDEATGTPFCLVHYHFIIHDFVAPDFALLSDVDSILISGHSHQSRVAWRIEFP